MVDHGRALKIAERVKVLLAEGLRTEVKDPDLPMITFTDCRVTGDLQHAAVFYTVLGDQAAHEQAAESLERYRGRLRSFVGRGLQIRLTPTLEFLPDALPESASHVEELLAQAQARDAELARARAGARPAGEADPYRHKADEAESADEQLA